MHSGRTLWEELCQHYQRGVRGVEHMLEQWCSLAQHVDSRRHHHVTTLLGIQLDEARWWRDACSSYFQKFSKLPLPEGVPHPEHSLDHYMSIQHHFVPGI